MKKLEIFENKGYNGFIELFDLFKQSGISDDNIYSIHTNIIYVKAPIQEEIKYILTIFFWEEEK